MLTVTSLAAQADLNPCAITHSAPNSAHAARPDEHALSTATGPWSSIALLVSTQSRPRRLCTQTRPVISAVALQEAHISFLSSTMCEGRLFAGECMYAVTALLNQKPSP